MANEETSMNDSSDLCRVLKDRAKKTQHHNNEKKEQAKSKLTFGFCSSKQTAGHAVKEREKAREREGLLVRRR